MASAVVGRRAEGVPRPVAARGLPRQLRQHGHLQRLDGVTELTHAKEIGEPSSALRRCGTPALLRLVDPASDWISVNPGLLLGRERGASSRRVTYQARTNHPAGEPPRDRVGYEPPRGRRRRTVSQRTKQGRLVNEPSVLAFPSRPLETPAFLANRGSARRRREPPAAIALR